MVKQGPCSHCGVTTTPLWRNGPPDKPVLCNACGSRWRTKGTLHNYMPMHSGGFGNGIDASGNSKAQRSKKSATRSAEQFPCKRKEPSRSPHCFENEPLQAFYVTAKSPDEELNRSEITSSEGSFGHTSCLGSNFPVHGSPWHTPIPSKKRTSMLRPRASSEKLARSLLAFDESDVSSNTCPSSEASFLDNKSPLVAVEIGLGSVLIRQPLQMVQELESEASSFLIESNNINHYQGESKNTSYTEHFQNARSRVPRGKEKAKQSPTTLETGRARPERTLISNKALLDYHPYSKQDVLQSCQSPLIFVELKDILNYDTFTGLLSNQEQSHLGQYLSSVDMPYFLERLRCLFSSSAFEHACTSFQQLLSGGMFDPSESWIGHRVLQHYQQLLKVTDLTACGWMDQNLELQNLSKRRAAAFDPSVKYNQSKSHHKEISTGVSSSSSAPCASFSHAAAVKRLPLQDSKSGIKGHVGTLIAGIHSSITQPAILKERLPLAPNTMKKELVTSSYATLDYSTGQCFNPKFSPARYAEFGPSTIMEEGIDNGDEPDLLLNVPTAVSYQEAQLLQQPSWVNPGESVVRSCNTEDTESGSLINANVWHMDSESDWGSLIWNSSSSASPGRVLLNGNI